MAAILHLTVFSVGCAVAYGETAPSQQGKSVPLLHGAYVWQRAWIDPVRNAVIQHGGEFSDLVVLRAEVSWRSGQPHVSHVRLDYSALRAAGRPIGLALRVGAFPGPFSAERAETRFLANLASMIVAEARGNNMAPRELQLDFDCAESKLQGYEVWVRNIRAAIAPVPLTITVLPSWLGQRQFKHLAAATDGYVLQVHSLERPRDASKPFKLCEPSRARSAVEKADVFGVRFRVALPTYGYRVAFDPSGNFIGISAEGPTPAWPEQSTVREVRADPAEMAGLVQFWSAHPPSHLAGIIWYRLPVPTDTLNWRWPTLSAIMALRSPRESMRAGTRRVEAGLIELSLVNDGELDISSRLALEVRWSPQDGTRLLAADGLRGFNIVRQTTSALRLESSALRLMAGDTQVVGWLRLNQDREVQIEWNKL